MARTFEHPSGNGYTQKIGFNAVLMTMILGPFYCLYHRAWFAAVAIFFTNIVWTAFVMTLTASEPSGSGSAVLTIWAIGTFGISLGAQKNIATAYLRRGWHEITR